MGKLQPNLQRAKRAIFLEWLVLLIVTISLIYFLISFLLINITNQVVLNIYISISFPLIVLGVLLNILSMIAFILWLYRAYYNLHQLVANLNYGVGWVVGCWFVPILNLYRPCGLIQDLFEKTTGLLKKNNPDIHSGLSFNLVGFWWISFIALMILRFIPNTTSVILSVSIIGIVSSLLQIKIIKVYSKVESLLVNIEVNNQKEIIEVG